jgi:hypothetical protein
VTGLPQALWTLGWWVGSMLLVIGVPWLVRRQWVMARSRRRLAAMQRPSGVDMMLGRARLLSALSNPEALDPKAGERRAR